MFSLWQETRILSATDCVENVLIITAKQGQMCNRLFQFAHLIAFCRDSHTRIANLAFYDYARFFASTDGRLLIVWPPSDYRMRNGFLAASVLKYCSDILNRGHFMHHSIASLLGAASIEFKDNSRNNKEALASLLHHRFVVVNGWGYWNAESLKKHGDEIRLYFTPKDSYVRMAKEIHSKIRLDSDMVVGLHVRRRDYKHFFGGKYCFGDDVYSKVMQEVLAQLPGKNVKFLIASDEPINLENYATLGSKIVWEPREPIIDLMALAYCDYIVGPPSTFSQWASFYGRVPLHMVCDLGQPVDLKNAGVVWG